MGFGPEIRWQSGEPAPCQWDEPATSWGRLREEQRGNESFHKQDFKYDTSVWILLLGKESKKQANGQTESVFLPALKNYSPILKNYSPALRIYLPALGEQLPARENRR